MRKIALLGGILLSAILTWFTVSNYQTARPIAEENLRGLALSLTSAIENIARHDPSLQSLETFQSHDIAFFALTDQSGIYRFHTNTDLIGSLSQRADPLLEARLKLKYQASQHTGVVWYLAKGISTSSPDYGTGLSLYYDF